jgi:tetratricopeptide (TPR) repeat protein
MAMAALCAVMCCGLLTAAKAQENLEELYLRKAVKEFVGKQYEEAIADLDQVLTVNHANPKARKLLGKCYERKGNALLAQSMFNEAEQALRKALEYDPTNGDATAALSQVNSLHQSVQSIAPPKGVAQEVPRNGQPAQQIPSSQAAPQVIQQAAAPIVITPQMMGSGDTNQAKVVTGLLKNFEKQQDMMAKQMDASNKLITNNDDSKDKYLKALMAATDQKNSMMKTFILIGGIVIFGVIVVVLLVFMIIFRWFAKSSELRTVQATETITALLAGPQNSAGGPILQLTGPNAASAAPPGTSDGLRSVTLEALNTADPLQRADAVEAVAAEIIDTDQTVRLEKIKKLGELLRDDNNRVRANAAKALYEVDKEASLQTLHDMMQSESNRMRASAVWALGEIGSEEALRMIMTVETESDEIVNYNIKMALEKIKTHGKFPTTKEVIAKIDAKLVQYAGIN